MDNEEKLKYVRQHLLGAAIDSIEVNRRYWNPSISRTLVGALVDALRESGYPVIAWEIPPQWEHVFYLLEDSTTDNLEIKAIAAKRFRLMEEGIDEGRLPK